MAILEVTMPRMGESVMEGTILQWLKKPGDAIEAEESLLEVATDKVDTEIPSPFGGIVKDILANEGDIVPVDSVICTIETEAKAEVSTNIPIAPATSEPEKVATDSTPEPSVSDTEKPILDYALLKEPMTGRFFSPLVSNIAKKENIPMDILEVIPGSGKDGRLTKRDLMLFLDNRGLLFKTKEDTPSKPIAAPKTEVKSSGVTAKPTLQTIDALPEIDLSAIEGDYEVQEMSRMRKVIAQRMIESTRISAHVTSFVEADVTPMVSWRHKVKHDFKERENTILTYTPIMIEAVCKTLKDFPQMNVSVSGDKIIFKKDINIGMAVALPDGNLIVPVIRNADQLNMVGLTKKVNDLAKRGREGKIKPEELQGGTFTISNVGSFGNLMGTPILVQPQVGILAFGAIIKKPSVIETEYGDTIAIRHKMFLSHSYDHRVVDGALGGMFVRKVGDYLESFDANRNPFG